MVEKAIKHPREVPNSFLDLQLMTTNTLWGSDYVNPELREQIAEELWSTLAIYTRDMRLSNLSYKFNEMQRCEHYINLAGDCINHGFYEASMCALRRAITILELAQSKGGFTRRQIGTVRQEHSQELLEPEKKSFWGGKQ